MKSRNPQRAPAYARLFGLCPIRQSDRQPSGHAERRECAFAQVEGRSHGVKGEACWRFPIAVCMKVGAQTSFIAAAERIVTSQARLHASPLRPAWF